MAPPVTNFAIKDSYSYLYGFGGYHQSEAFPGANSLVNNSPQKPPYSLRTERISGSSFTAPRELNLQTWLYRSTSSLTHSEFVPCEELEPATILTPNAYSWPAFDLPSGKDWTSQKLLGRNGDPAAKNGLAVWVFSIEKDMPECTAYSSLDGDCLIIPQAGALDIQTELGKLLVRQNEIAVIPRGVRYRVTLPAGPTRGYLCEVFQGHFQLPVLGIVGSTGLANVRDFQIPTAFYDGSLSGDGKVANANNAEWAIKSRLNGRLWKCDQDHTPFDVAAWHGTFYPFKYDLARFCHLGNAVFDEHDPSLFVVLTVPSHREPGTAVLDFAVISERWQTGEDTLWIPYYHRNTMSEFYGPIINNQDPRYPFTEGAKFKPFAAGLNGSMATHGANEDEYARASDQDTSVPKKQLVDGISIFLLETEMPLLLTDWAFEGAVKNFREKPKGAAKITHSADIQAYWSSLLRSPGSFDIGKTCTKNVREAAHLFKVMRPSQKRSSVLSCSPRLENLVFKISNINIPSNSPINHHPPSTRKSTVTVSLKNTRDSLHDAGIAEPWQSSA